MKKRIFSGMLLLTIISLLMVSITLSTVFYWQTSASIQKEMRERAVFIRDTLTISHYESLTIADMRVTIIAPDGRVIYDDAQDAAQMPSHEDREEIKEALALGIGESRRFSDTLGQETYYFAIRLGDGSILRLAKTISSIWGVFAGALPAIALVILVMIFVGYFLTEKLTKRIIDPINDVDLEGRLYAPYDELAHFVQTISRQREQITQQMMDLQDRTDTIFAIMNSMSEGLILVNAKGELISVNQSAVDIFGISRSVIGKNLLESLRDVKLNEHMRWALAGARSEFDFQRGTFLYHVYFSPVAGSGAVILFLDVTEKAATEKLRREFSANVSHELKTPLTTIYGNIEMLESGMVKDRDKEQFYGKMKDEAERLIAMIEDIMMLSQLDEENKADIWEEIDLLKVAEDVMYSLSAKAEKRGIAIDLSGGCIFSANHSQMMELFYNLMDNAIKYNKPDGNVAIHVCKNGNQPVITVTDTGIGIPEEAQSRIFERFYRVDQSRSKKTGGTGLGLAIVKHIAAAYNGSVEVQSVLGKGTTIIVTLDKER